MTLLGLTRSDSQYNSDGNVIRFSVSNIFVLQSQNLNINLTQLKQFSINSIIYHSQFSKTERNYLLTS